MSENQILRADDLYHVYDTEAVDGNIVALCQAAVTGPFP